MKQSVREKETKKNKETTTNMIRTIAVKKNDILNYMHHDILE